MRQLITILVLTMLINIVPAQTATIEGGASYGTITEALMNANPDDIILISGIFTEPIDIDKSITLRGSDPTVDIIEAASSPASDGSGKRVVGLGEGALTITIENLGIRYGNAGANGGGINVEKITGLVTLKNLIIENNFTTANGGAITAVGSNVDIIECSIVNNTSGSAGGGLMLASNNAAGSGIDMVVNIKQSLINNNSANNGGGIYLNGNPGFGQNYTVTANIENTTISNNTATTGSSGPGGGAIWAKAANHSPGGSASGNGNTILQLVHTTVYNNIHGATAKSGLQFASGGTFETFFSAYNSIIVGNDDLATGPKAINFAKVELTEMINCILGGLINATTADTDITDDVAKNNQKGKTASESGLTGTLSPPETGKTQVIPITFDGAARDFCSATVTLVTIPDIDQRGESRTVNYDAGASEYDSTLSVGSISKNNTFRIYPNPTKDLLHIKSVNTLKEAAIYDMTGKSVFRSQKVYNNSLDVSNLNTGLYTIKIKDNESNVSTQKLLISN